MNIPRPVSRFILVRPCTAQSRRSQAPGAAVGLAFVLIPATAVAAFDPGSVPVGRIAYTTTAYDAIRILDTSTATTVSVPLPAGRYYTPDWTPDGWLVFQSGDHGNATITTVHPDGTGLAPLSPSGNRVHPDVSRDGEMLAYQTVSSSFHTLRRDGAGGETTYGALSFPQWSPDGKGVIGSMWGISGYETDLLYYDLAARTYTALTARQPGEAYQYGQYSPDGSRIIGHRLQADGHSDLVLLNPVLQSETILTTGWPGTYHGFPAWDDTGEFIIFLSDRDGPKQLWSLRLEGDSDPVKLTEELIPVGSIPSFLAAIPEPGPAASSLGLGAVLLIWAACRRKAR